MSHTVLVVEDNAAIREILEIALSDAGFAVVAAERAHQVMQQLKQLSQLDLVLADFNLPDGRHLVPDLKKARPELPVIVPPVMHIAHGPLFPRLILSSPNQ